MKNDHAIIAAHDQSLGIGKDNKIPWHIKADMHFFKTITSAVPPQALQGDEKQNAVIMGRKTWQSLPEAYRPLSERLNIVLTKTNSDLLPKGVLNTNNLNEAIIISHKCPRIFIIGGAAVYKEAINMDIFATLYITEVDGIYDCDTFFPDYKNIFELVDSSDLKVENNYRYRFKTYSRKK